MTSRERGASCRVAVFRPDDHRMAGAVALLESLGAEPIADPMLEILPTGALPQPAAYVVLTSATGADIVADADWDPGETTLCAVGEATADRLRGYGYRVDVVPETYSSQGLVDALAADVADATVEVARSDHGSDVLIDGLEDAGAIVHETVLYRLARPADAGRSVVRAADGDLDAAVFTSSLTVEHVLECAEHRGIREAALAGFERAVVGVIGEPTRAMAAEAGIEVDVVASEADFETLACETVEAATPSHHA
jgi:uroporphyrinogen-III synthase